MSESESQRRIQSFLADTYSTSIRVFTSAAIDSVRDPERCSMIDVLNCVVHEHNANAMEESIYRGTQKPYYYGHIVWHRIT